jgi:hypothetical protein
MLRLEVKHECKSYWRNDGLYDLHRNKNLRVKIFGLTIWHTKSDYDCDLINVTAKNEVGFKK